MGQILHGSAKTTHIVRAAIQQSKASIKDQRTCRTIRPQPEDGDEVEEARLRP